MSWDAALPMYLHTRWLKFRDELSLLNNLKIDRHVICKEPTRIEMHGFSDASVSAYGACVYLKSEDKFQNVSVKLVVAKSKVAPLKPLTIPRLELTAALLLARLIEKVKISLGLNIQRTVYWCDSMIVLGWLNMSPSDLQIFVGNRVSAIQELSNVTDWRHVPTKDNPADHVSRGVTPGNLLFLDLYWSGPAWLKNDDHSWPIRPQSNDILPEIKKTCHLHTIPTLSPIIDISRFSNLNRLLRTVAYVFKFIKRLKTYNKTDNTTTCLSSDEIEEALNYIVNFVQYESFKGDIDKLKQTLPLPGNSSLIRLNPFLDSKGLLRVGGRLENSNFNFEKKHTLILPGSHYFTKLLFNYEHKKLLHAGPQLLLANIREKFWPLSARNLARKVFHDCVICFKAKQVPMNPPMGNLPKERLQPAPAFHTVGVDDAGPFLVRDRQGRGFKTTKAYIALFICFVTRAIHLELVSDLTTEAFLASFRRFCARRGKPAKIFSDNGSNFIGANHELNDLGIFLKESSSTLVESIEIRPISPLSSDPLDLNPLTPAHFLIGRSMTALPDADLSTLPINRLSHFQYVQQLQQHFWSRWSREYISELQQRCKRTDKDFSLNVNDLVIVKEDNQPPCRWILGRITSLHPGRDGICRVASISTNKGNMKRAVAKLCPLPNQKDVSEMVERESFQGGGQCSSACGDKIVSVNSEAGEWPNLYESYKSGVDSDGVDG